MTTHRQESFAASSFANIFSRCMLLALTAAVCLPANVLAQGVEYVKANYTKYEYRIPMRDGKRLFTAVYVPEGPVAAISDPALSHAVQRAALRGGSVPGRPGPVAAVRQGGLHLRLSGRARAVDVGRRVRRCPALQARQERPAGFRREHRHLGHDRLAGQARRQPQRQGGHVGHFLSGLLHGDGHDRRPSGAEGGFAAGPDRRLVHRRRLAPQRGADAAARIQLHGRLRPPAARADQEVRRCRSTTRRPTATSSSSTWGRWPTRTPSTSRTTCRSGTK